MTDPLDGWWDVSASNCYAIDIDGMTEVPEIYYRSHSRTPCEVNAPQTMSITCAGVDNNGNPAMYLA
ncbi:MAG: hypothetical protein ACRENK_01570, partial [Gemmatimonadaceae bacterium]